MPFKGYRMKKSRMGLIDTIKRIRVKKREKHQKKISLTNKKTKIKSKTELIKINEMKHNKNKSKNRMFFGLRIKSDEKNKEKFEEKKENKQKIKTIESKKTNSIIFDHELTEFEYKLRYLNLKDITGKEYGRLFPPIKSKLIILDNEGRKYSIIRAGNNQISGDLYLFFNQNNIKPGDIFSVEYDREEYSEEGKHIIHLIIKK